MLFFLQKNLNSSNVNCVPLADIKLPEYPDKKILLNSLMVLFAKLVCLEQPPATLSRHSLIPGTLIPPLDLENHRGFTPTPFPGLATGLK